MEKKFAYIWKNTTKGKKEKEGKLYLYTVTKKTPKEMEEI